MHTSFEKLSDNSKIWIYQADRPLSQREQEQTYELTEGFITKWAAHGNDLQASFKLFHDYFLVIATDEGFNMASGCSIDSSFRFVQDLGQKLGVDFFKRTKLLFEIDSRLTVIDIKDVKHQVEAGNITPDTAFFDNNIKTKGELATNWLIKSGDSWLSRYFRKSKSVL